MANRTLREHPAIQRLPQQQKDWIGFILALEGFVSTGDQVDEFEYTNILPITGDVQAELKQLELDSLHVQLIGLVGELKKRLDELELQQVMSI